MRFECQSCLHVYEGKTATSSGPCPNCGSTYSIIAPTNASAAVPGAPPSAPSSAARAEGLAATIAQPLAPPPGADPGLLAAHGLPPTQALPMNVAAPAGFGPPAHGAHNPYAPQPAQNPYAPAGQPLPYAPAPNPYAPPQTFGQNPFAQAQGQLVPYNAYAPGALPAEAVNTTTPMILGVVSLLCGCMPLGIASIVLAQQATEAVRLGDLVRARDRARTASILAGVNIGLMVFFMLIYLVMLIAGGA